MERKTTKENSFSRRQFYTTSDSGIVFLFAMIVPTLVALVFLIVMEAIALYNGAMTSGDELSVIYDEIWFSIPYVMIAELAFFGIYFFFHKAKKISFSATRISVKKANIWTVLICAGLGIVCVLGFMWLIEGCFGSLFETLGWATDESSSVSLPLDNFGWLILNYLLMGILPAFCEELICRGVIYKGLRNSFSTCSAVILSALLFALMHASIEQFVYPLLIGIVLAVVMESTNNLLYCMILHAFNNCTTLTIEYLMKHKLISLDFSASFITSWWGILVAIALAALTILILFLVWKFYFSKHSKLEEEQVAVAQDSGAKIGKMPLTMLIGIFVAVLFIVISLI